MTAPGAITVEGGKAIVEVPADLRSLLDRAEDVGDVLVDVARRFARLQAEIDTHVLALANWAGENGDGKVLAQVQSGLSDPVDATVSLVVKILGFYGEADPEAVAE